MFSCFAEERQLAIEKMSFGYLLFSFFEVIYVFFSSSGSGIFCKTANLVFLVFHSAVRNKLKCRNARGGRAKLLVRSVRNYCARVGRASCCFSH